MTIQPTGQLDMDICQDANIVSKVRDSDAYAQHLYAALCNTEWQYLDIWPVLKGDTWCCTWRYAGGVVADIRGQGGDYQDYYCSGMMQSHPDDDPNHQYDTVSEGTVTDEVREDLKSIGWVEVS